MGVYVVYLGGLSPVWAASCCEHGNEPSGFLVGTTSLGMIGYKEGVSYVQLVNDDVIL